MLSNIVNYNPETGIMTWASTRGPRALEGEEVGCQTEQGYRRFKVDGVRYFVHRVAWELVHGVYPIQVDHINGDRSDNRICNLREADSSLNALNKKKYKNGSNTHTGIYPKSYGFEVHVSGRAIGYVNTLDEALSLRDEERNRLGFTERSGK